MIVLGGYNDIRNSYSFACSSQVNGVFRLSFQERKMELLFGYGVFRGEFKLRFRITVEYLVDERKINASL